MEREQNKDLDIEITIFISLHYPDIKPFQPSSSRNRLEKRDVCTPDCELLLPFSAFLILLLSAALALLSMQQRLPQFKTIFCQIETDAALETHYNIWSSTYVNSATLAIPLRWCIFTQIVLRRYSLLTGTFSLLSCNLGHREVLLTLTLFCLFCSFTNSPPLSSRFVTFEKSVW